MPSTAHGRTRVLAIAAITGSLAAGPAVATSSYSAQAYAMYGPGSSESGPTGAGATDSHAEYQGTASALTETDPYVGGHGRVATSGCMYSPLGQEVCNGANTYANTGDEITIVPTAGAPVGTHVDVRFDLQVDGSVTGYGAWGVLASLSLNPCFGCIEVNGNTGYSDGTGGTVQNAALSVHETRSFIATLTVGTTYALSSRFELSAAERVIGPGPYAIVVDFYAGGGTVQAFLLTGGTGPLQFLGSSGRDYFQPPAAFADTDLDTRRDALDNCTLVPNFNQLDANADGYGNACDADLDNNGTVTATDFALLRSVLGAGSGSGALAAAADLDGNGTVTATDFAMMRKALGGPPGPSGYHPNCPPTCP